MSHPAVSLAIAVAASATVITPHLLIAGIIDSIVPEADALSLKFGIAYEHDLGHRGFTHSLLFAITLGTLAAWAARALHTSRLTAFFYHPRRGIAWTARHADQWGQRHRAVLAIQFRTIFPPVVPQ
jgi:membrane-bound metal-dependent hydrolase YbcI (DUF457 family)